MINLKQNGRPRVPINALTKGLVLKVDKQLLGLLNFPCCDCLMLVIADAPFLLGGLFVLKTLTFFLVPVRLTHGHKGAPLLILLRRRFVCIKLDLMDMRRVFRPALTLMRDEHGPDFKGQSRGIVHNDHYIIFTRRCFKPQLEKCKPNPISYERCKTVELSLVNKRDQEQQREITRDVLQRMPFLICCRVWF